MKKVIKPRRTSLVTLFLLGLVFSSMPSMAAWDSSRLTTKNGREVILHGYNTSGSAKVSEPTDSGLPWISEQDVDRAIKRNGNNSVRLLIAWAKIMPVSGQIDHQYLANIEQRVRWYTDRGAQVVLDMHQDVYSGLVNGNGAPYWATDTNGITPWEDKSPWWLNYFDPAVEAAFKNLLTNKNGLADRYADAWVAVALRFRNNPNVIGYDLINEPYVGPECTVLVTQCTRVTLVPFYQRIISRIRKVDQKTWIFFEPLAIPYDYIGSYSLDEGGFNELKDATTDGNQRLVFAPHFYQITGQIENAFYRLITMAELEIWKASTLGISRTKKTPIYLGEFGFSSDMESKLEAIGQDDLAELLGVPSGAEQYMDIMHEMTESNLMHWAWWVDDPEGLWPPETTNGELTLNGTNLLRAYPKFVAGKLLGYSFSKDQCQFEMNYVASSGWTEIFLPQYCFGASWRLSVTKQGRLGLVAVPVEQAYDGTTATLRVKVSDLDRALKVVVSK